MPQVKKNILADIHPSLFYMTMGLEEETTALIEGSQR